jgi:O-antigen/teichoic acid export membrane protein
MNTDPGKPVYTLDSCAATEADTSVVDRANRPSTKAHWSGAQRRRLTRHTLQLFAGRIALFVLGYPIAIILARELGPAAYGIYGIILSVLTWIEHTGTFGITEAVTKLVAENEDPEPRAAVEGTGQTLLLMQYLLLFAVCWVAAPFVARLFRMPEATSLFRVAIIDIPFCGMYFAYQGILGGRRAFGVLSVGMVVYGLTKFVGIFIALLLGISIFSALIVNILATVAALSLFAVYVYPTRFCLPPSQVKAIVQLAVPIGLYFLASVLLFNVDFWSLRIIGAVAPEVIGIYAAALNVAKLLDLASSAISDVLFPSAAIILTSHDTEVARRYIQAAGRMLLLGLIPFTMLFALTAEDLLTFLYGGAYSTGASVLALLVFAFALFGIARAYSGMLIAQGSPYLATGLACLAIPVAIVLNVALVPTFGAIGAATSLVLTALFTTVTTGWMLVRQFGSLIRFSTLFKALAAAAVMAMIAPYLMLTGSWLVLKYMLLIGVYGLVLLLLQELDENDVSALAFWRRKEA